MDIKDLKPRPKVKIHATIDADVDDKLLDLAEVQNVKFSQAVNFILKAGLKALER